MYIGNSVYVKHENKIKIGKVELIFEEEMEIRLEDGTKIIRKFWEIRSIPNEKE